MTYVVFGEKKSISPIKLRGKLLQFTSNDVFLKQLFAYPNRNCHSERLKTTWCKGEIGLEEAFKFQKRLLIEYDVVDVIEFRMPFLQTITDRVSGKTGVLFLARETLFLRGRYETAVDEEPGGTVVVESGYAEDLHGTARTECR